MTETQKMFEIIHQNYIKQREINAIRAKKEKRDTIISNIILTIAGSTFLIGVMTLVAVIENLKF